MNNVLELKGQKFIQASRKAGGGGVSMNGNKKVTSEHILKLIKKLNQIKEFWESEKAPFSGILLSVHYNKIAAKSNRVSTLLKGNKSNNAIVGAKFDKNKTKHIITYFLEMEDLDKSIELLCNANKILNENFTNGITKEKFNNKIEFSKIKYNNYDLSETKFRGIIADTSYIETFEVEIEKSPIEQSIITLFNIGIEPKELLKDFGIDILSNKVLDNQTVFLDKDEVELLFQRAPYLVSMATVDLSELSKDDFNKKESDSIISIPKPTIEPTIGVIDTLFDTRVYFSDWVDYHDMVDKNLPRENRDYSHGTAVSSIIVDGPRFNQWLDDGCGRFKVRHFGVAIGNYFSSFTIMKQIKDIILSNKDIKVWNLSLGSNQEINDNFISAEAATLDQLQYENDIIFVIAGTNKALDSNIKKIGSPADSINSMVVNAVKNNGISTSYSRKGLALSFFAKPDVSYYGGSKEQYITVCDPNGAKHVSGTSYAAPWISRKLSYLIDILGLNREVAKALIIDSAKGWNGNPTPEEVALYGHGVVPIRIEDIIKTNDDEIKFLVSDISKKWNTYNYNFPVPLQDGKYPYIAKATMCYFPKCSRTQGVDYTNTELNLHFGRIKDNNKILEINNDKQNQENDLNTEKHYILEGDARSQFRKWDNVKYISEIPKKRNGAKKSYKNKNWGIEVKTTNRLDNKDGDGVRFGIVVTLKEINGVNRIDEFIRSCYLSGWLVNEIDIKNRIDIHEKINEEIIFE